DAYRGQRRRQARRQAGFMFLDGTRERQSNAFAGRIAAEVGDNLPVKGNMRFLRPLLHFCVIVGKLGDVKADTRKETERAAIGERSKFRQAFRKRKRFV